MIDEQKIEHTLELHKKAYELLMWLKQQAKTNSSLLNNQALEEMSSADTCQDWVSRHCSMFPVGLRPAADDISGFSHLFSSFFATSFRVGLDRSWRTRETTLLAGVKKFRDGRHKKNSDRRELEAALALKRAAVNALAVEAQLECESVLIERFLTLEEYKQELALWTYIRELIRRTEFASQGSAVHRLWLELNEKTRKNLSRALVSKARSLLLDGLKIEADKVKNEC